MVSILLVGVRSFVLLFQLLSIANRSKFYGEENKLKNGFSASATVHSHRKMKLHTDFCSLFAVRMLKNAAKRWIKYPKHNEQSALFLIYSESNGENKSKVRSEKSKLHAKDK